MTSHNIAHLQTEIERALVALAAMEDRAYLPPALRGLLALAPSPGERVTVTLEATEGDEERTTGQWRTGRGFSARIEYGLPGQGEQAPHARVPLHEALEDVVRVMARAERNPQLSFVALKFLRDRLLLDEPRNWVADPMRRQDAVSTAIERGYLKTSRKPNPRNPDFPVTAVELVRAHPEVVKILEAAGAMEPPAEDEVDEGQRL